jgi:uncharacterized membrane protein
MKKLLITLVTLSTLLSLLPISQIKAQGLAENGIFTDEYLMGEVISTSIVEESEMNMDDGQTQKAQIKMNTGSEEGNSYEIIHQYSNANAESKALSEGESVVIVKNQEFDEAFYYISDKYRLPWIIGLLLAFALLAIAFTGLKGFTALIGLGFNILVIVSFIIPQIINGSNPLLISFLGGLVIAVVSLYFAHGFNRKTSIALVSTLITLVIALGLSVLFVWLTKLSGTGTEEAFFLQFGDYANINLKGLFLGGIIIGTLGVLDDVTTAQTAAIVELKRANPRYKFADLYKSGISIGSEHITSLVNTLALAYAGSAMPVLLLFTLSSQPLWVILNSELVSEELVRTLVGSISLILAVPISTALAAHWFGKHKLLDYNNDKAIRSHQH